MVDMLTGTIAVQKAAMEQQTAAVDSDPDIPAEGKMQAKQVMQMMGQMMTQGLQQALQEMKNNTQASEEAFSGMDTDANGKAWLLPTLSQSVG